MKGIVENKSQAKSEFSLLTTRNSKKKAKFQDLKNCNVTQKETREYFHLLRETSNWEKLKANLLKFSQ